MIQEVYIEAEIDRFENDTEAYESALSDLMDSQPALLAFMSQESNDVLTEHEKDIMWYITTIIVSATRGGDYPVGELSDTILAAVEETNWSILQDQPKGTFRERVTVFFEDYEQEDLLAFVEDTLEVEEESPVTSVGREVIFVMMKSIIDAIFTDETHAVG